jgi:hypothetical protein
MDSNLYIKCYSDIVPSELCREILQSTETVFVPSTYSNDDGVVVSTDRVSMDEFWIKPNDVFYPMIKECYETVIKKYKEEFSDFTVQHTTDFRINRYKEGHFMSRHVDNIHHSHGQKWGYPQVSALLYLNDDYEGGEFQVSNTVLSPSKGSAIVFPSNFIYPHSVSKITKGTRWSIITWLM